MEQSNTSIRRLCDRLEAICASADEMESAFSADLARVHPKLQAGARNLLHYVALRQADIRDMQQQLQGLGLSSLGRAEGHTRSSIQTVLKTLKRLYFDEDSDLDAEPRDFTHSDAALAEHTRDLLGDAPDDRLVRIMVTLPSEAAGDDRLVRALIAAGMNIARINTAHDDGEAWLRMIRNINRVNEDRRSSCKIFMDLVGPKIRTGPLKPGPRVMRVRPVRDPLGRVIAPRRLRLVSEESGADCSGNSTLPVAGAGVNYARKGDEITFHDTRGKKRSLIVVAKDKKGVIAEIYKTSYIATGTKLRLRRRKSGEKITFRVGTLAPIERPILLRAGDTLKLSRGNDPGEPALIDDNGDITQAAHIACSPAEVFRYLSPGAEIRLNDGKIEGIVRSLTDEELSVEITQAKQTGSRLRGGKGINFPNSNILLTGPTDADRENLPFIAGHASAVGLSFVREPEDITALQTRLEELPGVAPGIILKIETESAFQNLPRLLLVAMRSYPVGVMIARGDLAVECGWERLAEIQEEILWLCEAARVPVIWATQVLEGETKRGRPSRAEITDAAMAQRADCVMLNKGPHIIKAIRMLDNILKRMQGHQHKKTPMLRKLGVSDVNGRHAKPLDRGR